MLSDLRTLANAAMERIGADSPLEEVEKAVDIVKSVSEAEEAAADSRVRVHKLLGVIRAL